MVSNFQDENKILKVTGLYRSYIIVCPYGIPKIGDKSTICCHYFNVRL